MQHYAFSHVQALPQQHLMILQLRQAFHGVRLSWHFHSKGDLLQAITEQKDFHAQIREAIEQITREIESGTLCDDEEILRQIAGAFYDFFTDPA